MSDNSIRIFDNATAIITGGPPDKMREMGERLRPMPANVFATKVINQVARNRAVIIVPAWWRMVWWLDKTCPAIGMYLAARAFRHVRLYETHLWGVPLIERLLQGDTSERRPIANLHDAQ